MRIACLIIGISLMAVVLMDNFARAKKISYITVLSLFLFGMVFSTPFLLMEHLTSHFKFYLSIFVFITLEFAVLILENRIKFFHDLVHHNVRHLRIMSFVIIGTGFAYSEVLATIIYNGIHLKEIMTIIPLKALFGIFIHTVLTSLSSLANIGVFFTENILANFLRFLSYYMRIVFVSISHYIYVFFNEHAFSLYILPFIAFNLVFFFWAKDMLDKKRGLLLK